MRKYALNFIGLLAVIFLSSVFLFLQSRDPDFKEKLVAKVISQCNDYKKLDVVHDVPILGGLFVWDKRSNTEISMGHNIPSAIVVSQKSEVVTVFVVMEKIEEKIGTYSVSGKTGYQQTAELCIAYWPPTIEGARRISVTQNPPDTRMTSANQRFSDRRPVMSYGSVHGDLHYAIANKISGLFYTQDPALTKGQK